MGRLLENAKFGIQTPPMACGDQVRHSRTVRGLLYAAVWRPREYQCMLLLSSIVVLPGASYGQARL